MKTNPICLLLLTITLSVQSAMAGRPSAPSVKMPAMHTADRRPLSMPSMQKMRPVAPLQRAAVPSVRMIKPSVPLVRVARPIAPPIQMTRPAVKPSVANAPATIVKPAGNGQRINLGAGRGTQTIPAAPVPSRNAVGSGPISGGLHDSLSAMQEGRAVADQLKQMKDLRSGIRQQGLPGGLQDPFSGNSGKGPHGQNQPDTDFGGDTVFTPREPSNPLDHSSEPGAGLTDIRNGSVKGQRSDSTVERSRGRDMSTTGRDLVMGGAREGDSTNYGRISHSDGSYDRVGIRTTPLNNGDPRADATSVWEHHDSNGTVTSYTENRYTNGTNGSYTTETVHRDAAGEAQDVVVVEHNGQTDTDTKTVYNPDGSVRSCDRNPEGSSTGGPVNGKRGSLQEQLGLKPIDLLRQPTEEAQSGGTNRMTSGQLRHDQVRPTNGGETPMPGGNRNRVSSNRFGNLTNPAPGFGESTASGNPKD